MLRGGEKLRFKGPWTPKLTYTFYPFSWKCTIFWQLWQ